MTKQLSPAAQAVLDTTYNTFDLQDSFSLRKTVAAALRAAADHDPDCNITDEYDAGWRVAMDFIDAIAAELEAQ